VIQSDCIIVVVDLWLDLARDARHAANRLAGENYRSCLNRAYYAAYSKITQELVNVGVTFPEGREGPSHPGPLGGGGIRKLIETRMPNMTKEKRDKLSELVGRLYTLRISADYKPSISIDGRDAREALSIMTKIFEAF
jgi:hypothetical protein